ncbi:MAG: DUF4402 domain-containing protein [Rhodospirillales bacterium]|nr:DUF4402 domain-containing protein [Rhodospirillales bacterium]
MDNKTKKILLGAATVAALGVAGQPADAATTAVNMRGVIVQAVAVTQTRTLDFATMTETGAGTHAVSVADVSTPSASITVVAGTPNAGGFQVIGSTGYPIDLTIPAAATVTHTVTPANTMAVTGLQIRNAVSTQTGVAVSTSLAATTVTGFDVGGTLNIGAGQAPGVYTGTVVVTALYQ